MPLTFKSWKVKSDSNSGYLSLASASRQRLLKPSRVYLSPVRWRMMYTLLISCSTQYLERRICVNHVCGTDGPSVRATIADYSRGVGILSGSLLITFHN